MALQRVSKEEYLTTTREAASPYASDHSQMQGSLDRQAKQWKKRQEEEEARRKKEEAQRKKQQEEAAKRRERAAKRAEEERKRQRRTKTTKTAGRSGGAKRAGGGKRRTRPGQEGTHSQSAATRKPDARRFICATARQF